MERLFDGPWMPRLHAAVALCLRPQGRRGDPSQDNVLVLVALKLLTAMTSFARGKLAAGVWERYHWSADIHMRLLTMRRRARDAPPATAPDADVRTQYILFLLACVAQRFHTSLKVAVLDLGAEGLPAIYRGLVGDAPVLVQHVLLVLHEHVFQDAALARATAVLDEGPPLWRRLAQGAMDARMDLFGGLLGLATSPLLRSGAPALGASNLSALAYRAVFKGLLLTVTELVAPEYLDLDALVELWVCLLYTSPSPRD